MFQKRMNCCFSSHGHLNVLVNEYSSMAVKSHYETDYYMFVVTCYCSLYSLEAYHGPDIIGETIHRLSIF